jgi:hypothetical protein
MGRRVVGTVVGVVCLGALVVLLVVLPSGRTPPRIALYGDSLSMQSAQAFEFFAQQMGVPVLLGAYNGSAVCDVLPRLSRDATEWRPTVAVLQFSGNTFTSCMKGYAVGTPAYYEKYEHDTRTALAILHEHGIRAVLVGAPIDAWPGLSQNVLRLNRMYAGLAASSPDTSYADAGQSVLEDGRFTWTLPCLSFESCTGASGTNVVRAPDGVHFCPSGKTTVEGPYDVCSVYSSGALRFALSMLGSALGVEGGAKPRTQAFGQAGVATRARNSAFTTLPVALRGSSSTKRNWRGTL